MKHLDKVKLDKAILYLDRISQGNHPVNNKPLKNEDALKDQNVIRCMEFIEEILKDIKNNSEKKAGRYKGKNAGSQPFPFDVLKQFRYLEDKNISSLTKQINDLVDSSVYKKLSPKKINDCLMALGYIEKRAIEKDGPTYKVPSEKGSQIGMYYKNNHSERLGNYFTTYYNEQAQYYIVNNLEKILSEDVKKE